MNPLIALLLVAASVAAAEAEVQAPIADRLATDDVDFQKHVVPMLGRLGCNGRACHGSFQGQGDFRLSLFGYDFAGDRKGLLDRADLDSPPDSYFLQKALGRDDHGGGVRLNESDWEYRLLVRWLETTAGTAFGDDDVTGTEPATLTRLQVVPGQIVFGATATAVPLQVLAHWDDGSVEDVTALSRFQSNDDQVAEVDETGLVTTGTTGSTAVVALYDNGVQPISVSKPQPDPVAESAFADHEATAFDQAVADRLRTLRIEPSERASDEEFLRRVHLDIAGTLPTADEVRTFLVDRSADKRAAKIDDLLETEAYAQWWTQWLSDLLGSSERFQNVMIGGRIPLTQMSHDWLLARVRDNQPYDELVTDVVLATSRLPGESYVDYCERYAGSLQAGSMTDHPGLVQYWSRTNFRKPEERAIGFAHTFLGLRIECAQCHKHPFDEWTQDDFQSFQNFFADIRFGVSPKDKATYEAMLAELELTEKKGGNLRRELDKLARRGVVVPVPELYDIQEVRLAKQREAAKRRKRKFRPKGRDARVLGGDAIGLARYDDPRQPLVEWLTGDARDLFARAAVNRIFSRYFGRGIVEPTDDLSLANPPSNPELLDYLTAGFIDSGYDLKWVHRTICNSRTYQTSWRPTPSNSLDAKHFARAPTRRLPAEVVVDAIGMATAADARAETFAQRMDGRAIANAIVGNGRDRTNVYASLLFGKSLRETTCDCERTVDPSLLQTIYLRNDVELLARIDAPNGYLASLRTPANDDSENPTQQLKAVGKKLRRLVKAVERAKDTGDDATRSKLQRQIRTLKTRRSELAAMRAKTPKQAAAGVLQRPVDDIVEELYLRTLSRFPTDDERAVAVDAIGEDAVPGVRDLLWALLNTREFVVNK